MKISAGDRLLILAPHPDDESLACGGLIQRAVAAGVGVRVIFATEGDNNPWPQRFIERRLTIGQTDRPRWGRRRRAEALAALARLGLPGNAARFLDWPDQGVTELLLSADEGALRTLCREIERWQPSLLVVPSGTDTHPDHSALFVLSQLALARVDEAPRLLRYLVHFPHRHGDHRAWTLRLRPEEIALKRAAILCHVTQMALSRKRFTSYAKAQEIFYGARTPHEDDLHHSVIASTHLRGALRLRVKLPKPHTFFTGLSLLVAFESLVAGSVRWSIPLPIVSRTVRIQNAATGAALRRAAVRISDQMAEVFLPIAHLQPLRHVFVKLQRRTLFFDDAGWREVPSESSPLAVEMQSMLAKPRDQRGEADLAREI